MVAVVAHTCVPLGVARLNKNIFDRSCCENGSRRYKLFKEYRSYANSRNDARNTTGRNLCVVSQYTLYFLILLYDSMYQCNTHKLKQLIPKRDVWSIGETLRVHTLF